MYIYIYTYIYIYIDIVRNASTEHRTGAAAFPPHEDCGREQRSLLRANQAS